MKRLAILIALLGYACAPTPAAPAESAVAEAPVASSASARMIPVESARNVAWLDAPARTIGAPDAVAVVGVPLAARVIRVRVRPGETVQAHAAVVDVVMPELVHAAGALTAANFRLEAHTTRLTRLQPLVDQGLARAVEAAEVQAQIAVTKAEREMARATLRAAGVSDSEATSLITSGGALSLRSPTTGTVTAVNASVGEYREPNGGSLVEVTQAAPAQVEARLLSEPLPGLGIEWVDSTRVVRLTLDAVSPSASKPDGARLAWFHPTDTTVILPADLVGRVRLMPPETWMTIPGSALTRTASETQVWIKGATGLSAHAVHVEMVYGDSVLVTGIDAGTRVLADATRKVTLQ